ncbi:tonB-system energizer ExbB [Testudinibacter sp. TR-2022]|uniref:tonB-system energizer ExbB n=1 Tax=Testudinibacter sp. TR-2022 TaxID=2585029 RepID=UPI00111B09E2|nr:tonB-system energizer ExbB [Testudinibacter sp. TR-2022]TNH06972.1 tonB-system energizer ExbB [Pasteurellaceae bacterium Phil11]TNH23371.1 tonB-system energizer ExbB [Testudinibacter sp. TR-2022]TNH27977.1 tonB-system energizer ExbB [Testudinibacter sp. TR-2022]
MLLIRFYPLFFLLIISFSAFADTAIGTTTDIALQHTEAHASGAIANSTATAAVPELIKTEILQDMSPLGMYLSAHPVVQAVIWILIFCSVLTWVIFFSKLFQLYYSAATLRTQQAFLLTQEHFEQARQQLPSKIKFDISHNLLSEINDELQRSNYLCDDDFKQRLDYRLDRRIQSYTQNMRYGIGPLATIGAVAPFIGLFGTVWGIMNSFIGIVHSQTTSLSVVAPGIAEALFATALGLVAAIPAVIIYNIFTRHLTTYRLQIENLAAILRLMIKRDISLHRLNPAASV